jgi:sialate O-acetylesterase
MAATPVIDTNNAARFTSIKIDKTVPGKFFPAMIQPLSPFAIKGFLWYQGETNCFQNETTEYTIKMQYLIDGWRELWKDKNLPFYFVQLAPYYYSRSKGKYPLTEETLPLFWEAQTSVLMIPHTGMVVTTDLVSTPTDLHPAYKWEIGRRLALWALAKEYGRKIIPSGPMYKQSTIRNEKIEITFQYTGNGLISIDGKSLTHFMIAGADGKFVPANAIIQNDKVLVYASAVPKPINVRFGWHEAAQPNLFNKDGLPAVPFRTDNANSHNLKNL